MRRLLPAILALFIAAPASAQSFHSVDAVVERGIRRGIYPGAVVVIGNRDSVLHARGYGHLTWSRSSPVPTPDSTLFDLASLTKVVATTSAAMVLVEEGRLGLDRPIAEYLPGYGGNGRERITVRMLLDHTSGLRPFLRFYEAPDRGSAIEMLYAVEPQWLPGAAVQYSDLNALLLGMVVEAASGEQLERFVEGRVFEPLEMTQTGFLPSRTEARRTAPSSRYYGMPVAGRASDPNTAIFGGVAGHAGLFSTGMDLARYARMWLGKGMVPGGERVLAGATINTFLTGGTEAGARLLGWDRPDRSNDDPGTFGLLVSTSTYGHTGWTGTQMWIDPERNLYVVFLTNRSFQPRARRSLTALSDVRATLADTVVRVMGRM
ncbi:MAG: serine hydrolase domain-containing protein [Gemmatimonadales bacterium]